MPHTMQTRLRAVVVSPDPELRHEFRDALAPFSNAVELLAELSEYPTQLQLARLLRVHCPHLLFVELNHIQEAELLIACLLREAQQMPVVGLGGRDGQVDLDLLREAMHLGVHDFLLRPFQGEAVAVCLESVRQKLEDAPTALHFTDHLYSFLPARPGVGATTLAVNTAAAFQRKGAPVLLVDLDLCSGLVRFLLQLGRPHSVTDAVLYASDLDPEMWERLVDRSQPIDILHSGRSNPQAQIHAGQLEALIDYARRHYGAMCFDLSGNFEAYSIQVLEDSKHIFLVTVPEPASLQLAREKLAYLESMGLRSRVKVLVNRAGQQLGVDLESIPEVLETPVFYTFQNDYAAIHHAVERGEFIPRGSLLGADCDRFATKLLTAPTAGWSADRAGNLEKSTSEKESKTTVPA